MPKVKAGLGQATSVLQLGQRGSSKDSLQQCRYGLTRLTGQASYCSPYIQSAITERSDFQCSSTGVEHLRDEEWRLMVSVTCSA